jgi:murein DD-endopeptidase MepM/ murein hydrolase activator NlpD
MDLAKVDTPSRSLPQRTFNRETTMPRQDTQRDNLEVNADIRRPNTTSNAEALAKLLGVASDVTGNIVGDIKAKQDTKDNAQAVFDYASGKQNPDLFKNSRAYYEAWQLEGSKAKSLDVAQKATEAVQTVLNNPDATPEDADAAIEKVFYTETHDGQGNLLDFGTPAAKLTLGNSLAEVKAKLMPSVHTFIKQRQDGKLMGTTFDNMMVERTRGAPIGDPKAVDPLAPLPDVLSPPPANPNRAPPHILGRLSAPFQGFDTVKLTGKLGDQRDGHVHNGEDFPVQDGTPIAAPMAGEVVASYNDTKNGGGESVRVKLANGAIVGFAHLSARKVEVGDKVNAGELLGLSGQTGDATGPHVHMTVVVNGQHVSPRSYFASNGAGQAVVSTGDEPQLASAPTTPDIRPGFDIEGFLNRLPPTIEKGDAKKWLLTRLYAEASKTGDASILNGLEDSRRPDGTPSFNPEELLQIVQTRDQIRTHAEAEREKQTKDLQSNNMDKVLQAFDEGHAPSDSWLAAQSAAGLLDPQQVHTLISYNRATARQEAAEARAEARADQAQRDSNINMDVQSLAVQMEAGDPEALGTTEAQLTERWQNGDFGPLGSKASLARYRTLRTALRQGQQLVEKNPYYARGMALLQKYKPVTKSDGPPLLLANNTNRLDAGTYAEMVNRYRELVDSGKDPGEAFTTVVDKYVRGQSKTSQNDTALNRLSYLKCKQAGLCK